MQINMEKIDLKAVEQAAAVEARKNCVINTVEMLKQKPEYQNRGKMMRLYMVCLALDMTVPVVQPLLNEYGIEL